LDRYAGRNGYKIHATSRIAVQTLEALSLEKHPDKTFIGKIERGFDFLGYHFSPAGLAVAKPTIAHVIEKASRLYEQERRACRAAAALEMYVRRWFRWARNGMNPRLSDRYGEPRQHHTVPSVFFAGLVPAVGLHPQLV